MKVADLIARLKVLPQDLPVVFADAHDRAVLVTMAVVTETPNWMTDGHMVRVCYLNPPLKDLDRSERK